MNNKILKKMALIILVIIGLIFMQGNVEAAGSFSIKVGKTTLTVGESTTFTTTTTKCGGKFSITSSNPSVVEVGGSFNWVENESQTINLNAKKAGKAKSLIQTSSKIFGAALSLLPAFGIDIDVKELSGKLSELLQVKNSILVFDDLERCDCPINDDFDAFLLV